MLRIAEVCFNALVNLLLLNMPSGFEQVQIYMW